MAGREVVIAFCLILQPATSVVWCIHIFVQIKSISNKSSHPQGPDENGHRPDSCSCCGPHGGRGGRHEWLEASTGLHEETALGKDWGIQGLSTELEDEGQGKYLAHLLCAPVLLLLCMLPPSCSVSPIEDTPRIQSRHTLVLMLSNCTSSFWLSISDH